jgi:hypothetical protein
LGLHRSAERKVSGGLEGRVYQNDKITEGSDDTFFAATKESSTNDTLDKILGNCGKQD